MNNLSPKDEMIQLIQQCILAKDFMSAAECLEIYKQSFGADNFFSSCQISITPVTAIYILSEDVQISMLIYLLYICMKKT